MPGGPRASASLRMQRAAPANSGVRAVDEAQGMIRSI